VNGYLLCSHFNDKPRSDEENMSTFVKLYDTVTITPSSVDSFVKTVLKDNIYVPSGNQSLRVDIVATHSGRLTRNHGFYLPQKMRDGVSSLLDNYGKPILTHHNSHDDPVGRIIDAKYIDTSMSFARDSAVDAVIKDLCKPGIPFYKSLDLVDKLSESDLLRDPSYPGLGHILITAEITDADAIQKILDKRFLTVSIGASTDRAICSLCKQDWVEEGPCEHTPGKVYDDALAYIIAGKLTYDEASFVNIPADALARIVMIHNGAMQDSIIVEESQQTCNVNANFYFTDSSSSVGGGTSMNKIEKAWGKVSTLVALKDSKKEDKQKALSDFLEEFKDNEDACVQEAKDKLAELESTNDNTNDGDEPNEADTHYEDMIAFGYELSLFDDGFEDNKLSGEQRGKMAKSAFGKQEEREYPVLDANHAKAGMAFAKKNDEAASVIACIRRKAYALKCPFNGKEDDFNGFETELDTILADYAKRQDTGRQGNTDTDDGNQDPVVDDDTSAQVCDSCKLYETKVDALRQELKDIYAEFDCAQDAHVEDLKKAKAQLADVLLILEQLNGNKIEDITEAKTVARAMPLEDLITKTTTLRDSLDMESILTKINDGMSQDPTDKVDDPTLNSDGAQDPTVIRDDNDPLNEYRDKYQKIKDKNGLKMAGVFIQQLVRAGLVPNNFDPENKGGSA
jgi:hypothetical protein